MLDSPQRAKEEYNLALFRPDDESVEPWTEESSADRMRDDFSDFEPRYVTYLGLGQLPTE
jgi:salicylate hydroxylase